MCGCAFFSEEVNAKPNPANYIDIHINSGNPTFPYPQFLEYREGKTLAKYNAEGVTHADMEKTGREAYRIMMNRSRYDGTYCGVKYISYNNFIDHADVDRGWGTFVSEGDGYALLAAALFADQNTFNGMWMWIHDNRLSNVKKYKDCKVLRPDYEAAQLPCWNCTEKDATLDMQKSQANSATDGDEDIAMALLIAYKQWGEWMKQDGEQVYDACNEPISYKKAAQDFIKAMVDTIRQYDYGAHGYVGCMGGDIGVDGYVKGGNTWNELTDWRSRQTVWPELQQQPHIGGGVEAQYVDYQAPAYYNEFARWLEEDGEGSEWQIGQFKRAEASSDWIMGQAYYQGFYPSIGKVQITNDVNVQFMLHNSGEDFRYAWRTILNYIWHGNPTTTWNPKTHMVEDGENTFERDMGLRWAEYLKRPSVGDASYFSDQGDVTPSTPKTPTPPKNTCSKMGTSADPGQPLTYGPAHIIQSFNRDGSIMDAAMSNYALGAAAPSVVALGDLELLGDMYRQSELVWDGANEDITTKDERYILNMPKYFHGMFRILPLLTETGNMHAPSDMKPIANMKVYMSVNKTYVYQDDDLEYTVHFRNYGSKDAEGVKIVTEFDPNYELISLDPRGKLENNKIVWTIGTVPGFKSDHLAETMDSVKFKVIARGIENPRICLTSTISGDNFEDWTSNEYPNNATYTMERNCVDVLATRTLYLKKTASRTKLNPNNVVKFTLDFGNRSDGPSSWLNGGRDNVRVSYGWSMNVDKYEKCFRFWHDAPEACINLHNYRFSYFMYDAAAIGLYDENENPTGWSFINENEEDQKKYGISSVTYAHQKLPYGVDSVTGKKWNQRFMIRFPELIMPASTHIFGKIATDNSQTQQGQGQQQQQQGQAPSNFYLIHHGDVFGPPFIRVNMSMHPTKQNERLVDKLSDDWSFDQVTKMHDNNGQDSYLTIVSPCYADVHNLGYPLTKVMRHACDEDVATFNRVLVEEFDGYTWRRVQGEGPLPGREAYDVTILDTIPDELEFFKWVDSTALRDDDGEKIKAQFISPEQSGTKSGVIKWSIPAMMVGEQDKLVYMCVARDLGCPDVEDTYYKNVAWISSKTDSPDSSQVELMTTCFELPPEIEPQTSLFKSANKTRAEVGEDVSYKVKFVNNVGTKVEGDCKSTNGWKALNHKALPLIGNKGIVLSDNSSDHFFAPEKSYGKDGTVDIHFADLVKSSLQSIYIVFRYVDGSGNPGTPGFRGVCIKLNINGVYANSFTYELWNDGKMIQSTKKYSEYDYDYDAYRYNNLDPVFTFKLQGDMLVLYINGEEDDWDTPTHTWTGLTSSGPGYFGVYYGSGNNATPLMTKFTAEVDYAFDLTLYDDVPAELENISNISDGGTYDASKRRITWPTVATEPASAIAPGDSIVYTFDTKVDNCGKYITNMGLATVYGQDTLKVLNSIECGVEECELVRADIQFANDVDKICEGDSVLLSGFGDDGKDGSRFMYEFFLDDVSLGRASYKGDIYVNKTGSYHVKVSSPVDPTCFLESKKITLTVNDRPVGQDFPLGTLCVGTMPSDNAKYTEMITTIDNRPSDVNYSWVGDHGGVPAVFPNVSTDAVGDFDKPYFLYTEGGCTSDTFHLTYTVADTAVVKLSDLTICSGQSGTLTAGTDLTYTYLWNDGSTQNELVTDQPGKYSVVVTTPEGCESKASATITVADELKVDLGADTTICEGNLPLVLDASSSYDTYEWTDGSTLSTLSVTASGEYEVKVTQGSCTGSGKINVTVSPTPVLKGTFTVTYLVNDTTAAGVFDKSLTAYDATVLEKESGITYVWYDENQNELSAEPIPDVPAGGGNGQATYYVKATTADGCESQLQPVMVLISGSPTPTASKVAYCLNASDVKPLEATPGDNGSATNWTLRWYDAAGNQLNDAPVPDVTVAGTTNYYVSQVDEQGTEGGKAVATVTVYALPQIEAEPQNVTLCSTPYALNTAFREANGLSVTYSFFDTNKDPMSDSDPKAEKSGTYYAKASYAPVTDLLCESADFASVDVVIDQITDIKVTASPSICPFGETELVASATSEGSALSFSWSGDATGSDASLKMKDETGEYGKVYSYKLQMTAGLCVFDTTLTVTVGRGELTGSLTANGVETKTYRTCGDEDIVLGATHEGTDFKWTTSDGVLLEASASTTVRPTQTTTYVLSFVNECETSDTMVVEVYPFSLSTQFAGLDTAVCVGSSASGSLILSGYDKNMEGSYIKWFKNDVELTEYAGLSTLEIPRTTAQDGGVYTFEASNGICLAKSLDGVTSAQLTVKPFVSFATPADVVVANGASVSLELQDLVPSDATVAWKGSQNEGVGNPYEIAQVFIDELFDVNVSADGYCERDAQLQLVVDAKVIVSASTSTPKICLNDAASVVADTTGTGHLLHPEQYSVVWYACDESGNCESLQMKGLSLTHYPESNISYYAVVTYGEQVAYSDTIPVAVIPQVSYSTSTDVVSCSGEEVTLSVEIENASDAVVTWADGKQGNTLTVNPTESVRYVFTITQDGICPQVDSAPVMVRENPSVTMGDDILVCKGDAVNFGPTVSGDDIDAYYWINPSGDTIAYTQNLTIGIEPQSGVYTFVASSKFCGEAVGTQKVDIAELPELLIDSLSINSRKLVPVGRAGQYEFKLDNKEWSTQDVYENLTYDYPHTALVRDELGCEGMTIFVVTAPPIAIPDYFTPSEDGLNDTWDLSTVMDAYPKTQVTIYDRSGKVVAVLEGDTSEWDGTYNGKPLPSTDYWYVINVPEIRRQFTGHFTLIRTK